MPAPVDLAIATNVTWLDQFCIVSPEFSQPRSNRKTPEHPNFRRYRDRNRIERMFGKLKLQRRIATRYDTTVLSFASFLNLAAARLWLKSFVNATQTIAVMKVLS